jgi:hypothetical protein
MPKRSARSLRITGAARILCAALWLAACGGGGSGGGDAATTTATTAAQTSSVTLAWTAAAGPVNGYSVYVQRGDSAFKHESDVAQARATLFGEPGSTARVIVVAYDASHLHGPNSPTSAQFTFPPVNANNASAAASGGASSAEGAAAVSGAAGSSTSPASASDPAESSTPEPPTTATALPGGALVWQSGDAFRLTDSAIQSTRLFARPADGSQLAGVADFDGDGQDDLLWRSPDGALGYMSGSELRGSGAVSLIDLGSLASGATAIGAGDFDGDGYGDVLVATADAIRAQLTVPGGAPRIGDLGSVADAALAGIADFDANGTDDIAWRTNTGSIAIWLTGRGAVTASVELALDSELMGIGDFDGDGAAELAVRARNGTAYVVHPLAAQPQLEVTDLVNTDVWHGMGALDLERDGSDELVLVTAGAIRYAGLPGDQTVALDPEAPWQLVALLP